MAIIYDYLEVITSASLAVDSVGASEIAANSVGDSEIAAHASTKITITTKGQLNSKIAYTDANIVMDAGFDINIGANKLKTTGILLRETTAPNGTLVIRNVADSVNAPILVSNLRTTSVRASDDTAAITITDVTGAMNFNSRPVSNLVLGNNMDVAVQRITKAASLHFDPVSTDTDSNVMGSRSNNLSLSSAADGAVARSIKLRTPTVVTAGAGTPADRMTIGAGAAVVDITINSADLNIGANKLKTTSLLVKEVASFGTVLGLRDVADANYRSLLLSSILIESAIRSSDNVAAISITPGTAAMNFNSRDVSAVGNLTFSDAKDIALGTVTGTKIGTATNQKLGFYNAAPVVQAAGIVDADGTLADITTKFNSLLAKMEAYGLLAVA